MSLDENKRIVGRFYEEFGNTGKVDSIEEIIAPEFTEVYGGKRYPSGIEGAKAHITGVRKTYPDLHITVDRQIAEGEWVVSCITARGTHKGSWLGMKPTNRLVTFTGVNVDRVVDGKIVEHGGAVNELGPFLEIGVIKVVGPDDN